MRLIRISLQKLAPLYYGVVMIAAILFVMMSVAHIATLLGYRLLEIEFLLIPLVSSVFIWMFALVAGSLASRDYRSRDYLYAATRACPRWLQYTAMCVLVYAVICFIYFKFVSPLDSKEAGTLFTIDHYRAMTAFGLPFLIGAIAVLVSAIRVAKNDPARRCANGHAVMPRTKFCEQCGVAIEDQLGPGRNGPDSTGD